MMLMSAKIFLTQRKLTVSKQTTYSYAEGNHTYDKHISISAKVHFSTSRSSSNRPRSAVATYRWCFNDKVRDLKEA